MAVKIVLNIRGSLLHEIENDPEVNPEADLEGNLEGDPEVGLGGNLEGDPEVGLEGDLERDPEVGLEGDPEVDLEESFRDNLGKNPGRSQEVVLEEDHVINLKVISEIVPLKNPEKHQVEYVTIVAYIHHFGPGHLRPRWIRHELRLDDLRDAIEVSLYKKWLLKASRRWLQKGEMPYPGYCRSPGSGKCLPVLCNCAKLAEIWKNMKNTNNSIT